MGGTRIRRTRKRLRMGGTRIRMGGTRIRMGSTGIRLEGTRIRRIDWAGGLNRIYNFSIILIAVVYQAEN